MNEICLFSPSEIAAYANSLKSHGEIVWTFSFFNLKKIDIFFTDAVCLLSLFKLRAIQKALKSVPQFGIFFCIQFKIIFFF